MSDRNKTGVYDGVICFGGGDWWYHNRGHYDMQMMRRFSRTLPVLYVNSTGVRVPSIAEGGMFFRRIVRKLRSIRRGFVRTSSTFGVISPVSLPGPVGMRLSRRLVAAQIARAARDMGISLPLIWITCPAAAEVMCHFPSRPVVYQRTDRWECFPGSDRARMRALHERLSGYATLTLFCSHVLFDEESVRCRDALLVDHGVDYEVFSAAGNNGVDEPADLSEISRPRVGFVGGIDDHTFDAELFLKVAGTMPQVRFVLVGACSLAAGWCDLPNVHLLGQRPYERVPDYMAACDVLVMPWNRNDWIQACNPVKLKEYLAVGRPVVSTDFEELKHYAGCVRTAGTAEQFVSQVHAALAQGCDRERQRQRVRHESWDAKQASVVCRLAERGWTLVEPALPALHAQVKPR